LRRTAAILALAALFPVSGLALDTVEILTTEYEPFCGTNGRTMWCDIVNEALSRGGMSVTWASYPQDREKLMVAEGTSVAFLSSTLVLSRSERPLFVFNDSPMIYADIVAFYPRSSHPEGLGIRKPSDLRGRVVGAILGTGSITVLGNAGVDIDGAPNMDLLMKKLLEGRYDVAVVADLTGLFALGRIAPDKVDLFKYETVYSSPIDLIFSAKSPRAGAIRSKYNEGIAEIKQDGSFKRIVASYYAGASARPSTQPKGAPRRSGE
jgi:ABC-type amino acid transport substrate-binding protein